MKRSLSRLPTVVLVCVLGAYAAVAQAAPNASETPVVKSGAIPTYPDLARAARLQGAVQLQVTTNGVRVTNVVGSGAHKMLVDAAEQNIRTWEFYGHTPQTFTVTFVYKLDEPEVYPFANSRVLLELPNRVEIRTNMPKTMP
jgi:TonB family protein